MLASRVRLGFFIPYCVFLLLAFSERSIALPIVEPFSWKYAEALYTPAVWFDAPVPACAYILSRGNFPSQCVNSSSITYNDPRWLPCDACGGEDECAYRVDHWVQGCAGPPETYDPSFFQNWVVPLRVCPPELNLAWDTVNGQAVNYRCVGPDDRTPPGMCPTIGNPVQGTRGWKYWSEVDFVKPFEFKRYYTSRPSNGALQSGIGQQWRHTYDRRIYLTNDSTKIWIVRDDGTIVFASQDGSGNWSVSSGSTLRVQTLAAGFRILTDEDEQEDYDATGLLTSILWRDGTQFTLAYEPDTQILASVTDNRGRSLSFASTQTAYGNRFVSVTDSAGAQLQFAYSDSGELGSVSWTDAGSVVRQRTYYYEQASQPSLLTGITSETGHRGTQPARQDRFGRRSLQSWRSESCDTRGPWG